MEKCKFCGGTVFTARQVLRADVLVDGSGSFLDNFPGGVEANCDADDPYGEFQCIKCGATYSELDGDGDPAPSEPIEGWVWGPDAPFRKFMQKGHFQRWDGFGYAVYIRTREKDGEVEPRELFIRPMTNRLNEKRPFLSFYRDQPDEPWRVKEQDAYVGVEFSGYGSVPLDKAKENVNLLEKAIMAADAIQTQFLEPMREGRFDFNAPAAPVTVAFALPDFNFKMETAFRTANGYNYQWADALLAKMDLSDPALMKDAYAAIQELWDQNQMCLYHVTLTPEHIQAMQAALEANQGSMSDIYEDELSCMVSFLIHKQLQEEGAYAL